MSGLVLRNYISSKSIDDYGLITKRFSNNKTLYDYQCLALKNAYKVLKLYYEDWQSFNADGLKERFYEKVYKGEVSRKFDMKIKNKKIRSYLPDDIEFPYLVNRASFWMATGSGKTLVIVKLIDLLKQLMDNGEIPKRDILFLTARDDLVEQFRRHVGEYNSSNSLKIKIELFPLNEFERVKAHKEFEFLNRVKVFYYRSDLISDEGGEKRIDFETVYNNGEWYLILDEAHKGDKAESKRQAIFTILTQNGFMFNFSATFTEEIDFWTCAYEYNLKSFVDEGYGKHIYVSSLGVRGFSEKGDFSDEEKTRTVLRSILLHTALCKLKSKLSNELKSKLSKDFYPRPLLMVLGHSVNTEDADIKLFFREVSKIAKGDIGAELFEKAKKELYEELQSAECVFTGKALGNHLAKEIDSLTYKDVLREFFYASSPSTIEVKISEGNTQELAFALKSASKPFGLIKIGDISKWLRDELVGYEVVERFSQDSYFMNINENEINLLMGSRAFYEGWDSPRPNVLLYINIGSKDAKKFVLQSLGRGVRVNPIGNKRQRLECLEEKALLNDEDIHRAKALEFLYVFGTKKEVLEKTLEVINQEKAEDMELLNKDLVQINPDIQDKLLLVPEYVEDEGVKLYSIDKKLKLSKEDYEMLKEYINCIPEVVFLVRHSVEPSIYRFLKSSLEEGKVFYESEDVLSYGDIFKIVNKAIALVRSNYVEFKGMKNIEKNDIIHFTKIKVSKKYVENIRNIIRKMTEENEFETEFEPLKISLIAFEKHYYIPILLSDNEKTIYITHVIRIESEKKFVDKLLRIVSKVDKEYANDFDWWYFSKVYEGLDKIYIPYYDGSLKKFYPDFIFWFKKKNDEKYVIIFVDPKGTEYRQAYVKIDGYLNIFTDNGKPKVFYYDKDTKVVVGLLFIANTNEGIPSAYKTYWISNVEELFKKAKSLLS
ncbi:MAG: DEAD/DEAH box helicase family protein [Desulfurococcaceae archaeon]